MSSYLLLAPKQSSSAVCRWGVRDLVSHSVSIFESGPLVNGYECYYVMKLEVLVIGFDIYMSTSGRHWLIWMEMFSFEPSEISSGCYIGFELGSSSIVFVWDAFNKRLNFRLIKIQGIYFRGI